MKVQIKCRDQLIEGYLIDENAIIYDLKGNIQKKKLGPDGRYYFKRQRVYVLVMHSHKGYLKGFQIHHLNEDKLDDRLENLVYLTISEHSSFHSSGRPSPNKGKKLPAITKSKIGNTIARGRVWINNGTVNKFVYPDQIPGGFVKGRLTLRKKYK